MEQEPKEIPVRVRVEAPSGERVDAAPKKLASLPFIYYLLIVFSILLSGLSLYLFLGA